MKTGLTSVRYMDTQQAEIMKMSLHLVLIPCDFLPVSCVLHLPAMMRVCLVGSFFFPPEGAVDLAEVQEERFCSRICREGRSWSQYPHPADTPDWRLSLEKYINIQIQHGQIRLRHSQIEFCLSVNRHKMNRLDWDTQLTVKIHTKGQIRFRYS